MDTLFYGTITQHHQLNIKKNPNFLFIINLCPLELTITKPHLKAKFTFANILRTQSFEIILRIQIKAMLNQLDKDTKMEIKIKF